MPDETRRTVLGLDRDQLVESATQAGGVMFLSLLFDDELGELMQPRGVAVLVSLFVLMTLAAYGLHVLSGDRARNDKLPWPWSGKSRKDRDSRHGD